MQENSKEGTVWAVDNLTRIGKILKSDKALVLMAEYSPVQLNVRRERKGKEVVGIAPVKAK